MPNGFIRPRRGAAGHQSPPLLDGRDEHNSEMVVRREGRKEDGTPNFDIASTCTIDGAPGFAAGRGQGARGGTHQGRDRPQEPRSAGAPEAHVATSLRIEWAIRDASIALGRRHGAPVGIVARLELPDVQPLRLELETRGASACRWSWSILASCKANDMAEPGEVPLRPCGDAWSTLVKSAQCVVVSR